MSFFGGIVSALRKIAPVVNKTARVVQRAGTGTNNIMRAVGVPRNVTRATQRVTNVASATSGATRASSAGRLTRPSGPLMGR